jgi:hypothetical protein
VDLDPLEIGDHEERWILERVLVVDELAVGSLAVLALALVLPGEKALLPDVGEAVTAVELLGALLERVPGTRGIGIGRGRLAEHPAEIAEVGLGGRALPGRHAAPLRGELGRGHPCVRGAEAKKSTRTENSPALPLISSRRTAHRSG